MHLEPFRMNRESPYPPAPAANRAHTLPLAGAWPFPQPDRGIPPELRRAVLNVLRTTARDWGLGADR